jgi:hypothetical protein
MTRVDLELNLSIRDVWTTNKGANHRVASQMNSTFTQLRKDGVDAPQSKQGHFLNQRTKIGR